MVKEPIYSQVVISSEGQTIRLPKCSAEVAQKMAEACMEAYPSSVIEIACDGIRTCARKPKAPESRSLYLKDPAKNSDNLERIFIRGGIDLYTADGDYLFSVMQGKDHMWRKVVMYKHRDTSAIANIAMIDPDYINESGMNFRECPFCKGRSSTCEDCCGSGWVRQ